jgi:hypothetical protein
LMTVRALCPCSGMLPRIDREDLVVHGEGGWLPSRVGGMAIGTGRGNISVGMVRICCPIIVCKVA